MTRPRSATTVPSLAPLGRFLLLALATASPTLATATGSVTGSLELEIVAPALLPPGFILNPGGTFPSHFVFEDSSNIGNGSIVGLGDASCTPSGCEFSPSGADIEYQLSNDLTCTADPDGSYGGIEDSFVGFSARNETGFPVALDLRFTSSWSVSATTTSPLEEEADASVSIVWPVPPTWCIELTSCASGTLENSEPSPSCPAGTLEGSLVLGESAVDTSGGDDSDTGLESICEVTVTVPSAANFSAGNLFAVTSTCSALSGCPLKSLSDDTILDTVTEEACRIEAGTNYMVAGPDGDLTLRAGEWIRLGDGFSVGVDGQLTLELDPSLSP